jgi:hypothetical protein
MNIKTVAMRIDVKKEEDVNWTPYRHVGSLVGADTLFKKLAAMGYRVRLIAPTEDYVIQETR